MTTAWPGRGAARGAGENQGGFGPLEQAPGQAGDGARGSARDGRSPKTSPGTSTTGGERSCKNRAQIEGPSTTGCGRRKAQINHLKAVSPRCKHGGNGLQRAVAETRPSAQWTALGLQAVVACLRSLLLRATRPEVSAATAAQVGRRARARQRATSHQRRSASSKPTRHGDRSWTMHAGPFNRQNALPAP